MEKTKCRVLYVDDNEDTRHLIELLLTQHGYEVKTAAGAGEALSLAKRRQFEIYVLDNRMPDMSGLEMLRRLRAFDPATPVVFYSAAATGEDRRRALEAGAEAYIVKPAELDEFIESISRTIEGAKREGRLETTCAAWRRF
jgi:DNA-binding response OmpR family regulator